MAVDYSKWLKRSTGYLRGFDWQVLAMKVAGVLILITGTAIVSYREGLHDCELSQAQETVTKLNETIVEERRVIREELQRRNTEILQRLNTISGQSQEAVMLRAELASIKGRLDEAIQKRPAHPACAPTPDELREYERIGELTRKRG